jgi:DNA ligase-1
MHAFARLLDCLAYSQSRTRKIALLGHYFRTAPDPERGWALAALTDGLPIRLPLRRMLSDLVGRFLDPHLYRLSRDYLGDTAETVSLLWPNDRCRLPPDLGLRSIERGDEGQPSRILADPETKSLKAAGHDSDELVQLSLGLASPSSVQDDVAILPAEAPLSPEISLADIVEKMSKGSFAERTEQLGLLLGRLDATGRWALLKLLGRAPRIGVSARLARTALAQCYDRDVSEIEEIWHALEPPYLDLFAWLDGSAERPDPGANPVFRPLMLAHPIEEEDLRKLAPEDFAAEWKWDGIRVQVAARGGAVRVYSRQGDDISGALPELCAAFAGHECVADGELLIVRNGEIAPFHDLQQRLTRKTVTARMMTFHPPHIRLYDLLFDAGLDLRGLPFSERRTRLEAWHARHQPPLTDLSPLIDFRTLDELSTLWASARADGIEGLMLKRRGSTYRAGRIKGQWFKWKWAPLTLDCVLMYAERGTGKRSSYYSDYTFGVWQCEEDGERRLIPIGKAYSGFSDDELLLIDRWVRTHTTETFGPVRAVEPGLVFEVAFDAVQSSPRHKSGVAMRFPRIHRLRWDKPAAEADTLQTVLGMVRATVPTAVAGKKSQG